MPNHLDIIYRSDMIFECGVPCKWTELFPSNAGRIAIDKLFFLFWISLSVLEIFTLKA